MLQKRHGQTRTYHTHANQPPPRSCSRPAVGEVSQNPSPRSRLVLVLLPLQVWPHRIYRIETLLMWEQRPQTWPADHPKAIATPLLHPHAVADRRHHPSLPLHCAQPGQIVWIGMPRAARKSLHASLFPGNMGDHGHGCGLLDRHAHPSKVGERPGQHCLHHILPDCGRAGG